jgi:predicted HicB family RNase H-like nuclease
VKQIHLRKVPDELHKKVKTAAAQAGKSMQDFIIEAMASAAKEAGKNQKS